MFDRRQIIAAAALAAAPSLARAASRWQACAPVPWAVQEVYGAAFRGKAAIAGGMTIDPANPRKFVPLDRVGFYDPAADRWTEGPKLPFARHHPVLATVNNRLYLMGGYRVSAGGEWTPLKDVLSFDGRGWSPAPSMPTPQEETVAVTLHDRIHVVSGRTPREASAATWAGQVDVDMHQVFDPKAGTWDTAAPCPMARNSAVGGVIDGLLYLAGGRETVEGDPPIRNTGQLERYDPKADRWERLAPIPRPAGGLSGATVGGRLYVFGGEIPGVIENCWSYSPREDAWAAEPAMTTPRHGLAAVELGGRIYAIGGGEKPSGGKTSAVVEVLIP